MSTKTKSGESILFRVPDSCVDAEAKWSQSTARWTVRLLPDDAISEDVPQAAAERLDAQNWCLAAERALTARCRTQSDSPSVIDDLIRLGVADGEI
jgi:hypothetical protein